MAQIHELTMIELAAAIRAGELSPVAVTDHYLRRTTELNDQVGAFYTITPELAADQARAAEKAVAEADDKAALPPLTGVPIPIKDLNMVAGVRQTLGSKAFEANVPDTDDYVVVAIKRAGAVITGKTAIPEFGLPCYTETAVGPPARTPWDLSRSAGGSSGGADAEVHPDCVTAYEEASALLASLGHEVEDVAMPLGPDVVPFFETLWYAYATLAPLAPEQEEVLLPLTRYLRGRGVATNAAELIFAQAYLQ